jgi:hypothetical protein
MSRFVFMGINNFNSSMEELIADSITFKRELFKTKIMHQTPNNRSVDIFVNSMYEFIKTWDEYSVNLQKKLKEIDRLKNKNISGSLVRDYDYIKKYVFAHYDYSSILQFIDGIIKGIHDEKFEDSWDINNFTEHTLSEAFNNGSTSVGELMEDLFSDVDEKIGTINNSELNLFYQVKNYNDLFKSNDRYELIKAMEHSINFLTKDDTLTIKNATYTNVKLWVAIINNITEYMVYSLLAYAGRIMVISDYCRPFISAHDMSTEPEMSIVTERATNIDGIKLSDVTENPDGTTSNVFNSMDEMLIKDPHRASEFISKFKEFFKFISITAADVPGMPQNYLDELLHNKNSVYVNHSTLASNKFHMMLLSNPLYLWKFNAPYYSTELSHIKELHHCLKDSLFNRFQGLSGSTTYKDELIDVIARVDVDTDLREYKGLSSDVDDTISKNKLGSNVSKSDSGNQLREYKKLAFDLYTIFIKLNETIGHRSRLDNMFSEDERGRNNLTSKKLSAEVNSFLINLYEEVMFAIAQKAKYIERKINILKEKKVNDILNSLTLDYNQTDAMTLSVPPTTRMPIDFISLYELPIFEEYRMFNEFLRSQPEFEDDWYLSEAGAADLIAKARSFLRAWYEKFMKFYRGTRLKLARQWIKEHKQKLTTINIPNSFQIEKGLPYKVKINIPGKLLDMGENINKFDEKKDLKDVESFIRKLYPDENIYNRFKADAAKGRIYYQNWVIFNDPTDEEHKIGPIQATKADLESWIQNIEASEQIANTVEANHKKLNTSIDNLNQKILSIVHEQDQNTNNTEGTGNNEDGSNKFDRANINELLARINLAMANLWMPLLNLLMKAMVDQYDYIKDIYSRTLASGGNTSTQSEQSQPPQNV